jgi:NAD(P)-dependent dehydrogenase (short-subunit alcohol dehydrogenase family)
MMRRRYSCLGAYGQSKLCNVLFAAELARRAAGTSVGSYAIAPGLVNTDIGHKGSAGVERLFWSVRRRCGLPACVPAGHIARIATSPEYAGRSGLYWRDGVPRKPSRAARDPGQARRLWELSERLCGAGEGESGRGCPDMEADRPDGGGPRVPVDRTTDV